jgi:hypothetical protein
MPDTQLRYWGGQDSINPEPQDASFRYIMNESGDAGGDNVVFMAHLGDLTEDAQESSMTSVGQAFDLLDRHGVAYSVLAGNHDVSGDDTRGSTPYLQIMGPQRFAKSSTFAGRDVSGYKTAHIFRAAGRDTHPPPSEPSYASSVSDTPGNSSPFCVITFATCATGSICYPARTNASSSISTPCCARSTDMPNTGRPMDTARSRANRSSAKAYPRWPPRSAPHAPRP